MIITRNHLPATNGPFSRDDLDALGDIQVEVEEDDLNGISKEVPNINYLRNADFSLWTRGTTAVSLSHQLRTERSDHWWARADYGVVGSGGSGTYATYERAADSAHQQWLYCAQLNGAAFTAGLDFGQDIPARIAAGLEPTITLTLEIENDTGGDLTPTVRLDTCNTFESWGSMTNRINQPVDSAVGNAARKTWTVTLDASGFLSSLRNGAQLYVRFAGANLNNVSKFVKVFAAKLESGGTATTRLVERDVEQVQTSSTGSAETRQYFDNTNFSRWLHEEVTCDEDKDNYAAPGWFAQPSDGSTMVYKRSTSAPDTQSKYCAELVGDAAVSGTVDFGQNLSPAIAGEARRLVVFSITLFNGTGSDITPELRIDTCDAAGTFDDVTNRISQILDPAANSAWTTLTYNFDASSVVNWEKGARIYLRFPTASLNSAGLSVKLSRIRLELGSAASSFLPVPDLEPLQEIGGVARGLKVKWVDANHLDVSFEEIVLVDRGGRNLRLLKNSYPGVDLGLSGAGGLDYVQPATASTWHYLWLASTGETSAVFISKDATEPTLATGYLFRARIGAFRTTAVPDIPVLAIMGDTHYLEPSATSVNNIEPASAALYASIDLSDFVPPEAREVFGTAGMTNHFECQLVVAATDGGSSMTSGLAAQYITGTDSPAVTAIAQLRASSRFQLPLHTPQQMWWAALVKTGVKYKILISGYRL